MIDVKTIKKIWKDQHAEGATGKLAEIAIGLTVVMIILGYIFAPVGLTAFNSVNRTAAGVAAGTTSGNIWDAIIPVSAAVIILALVIVIRKSAE